MASFGSESAAQRDKGSVLKLAWKSEESIETWNINE